MGRLRTGPQPSMQVRGSRPRVGVPAPPGAVLKLSHTYGCSGTLRPLWTTPQPRGWVRVWREVATADPAPRTRTQGRESPTTPQAAYSGLESTEAVGTDEAAVRAGRICGLRRQLRWSQERLAEEAGVSVTTIKKTESGRGEVTTATLHAIARAFGTTTNDLYSERRTCPYSLLSQVSTAWRGFGQ